jgi:hypothetical protein
MTTLATGQRQTEHLPAYHALTVIASASGSGVVWRLDVSERTLVPAGQTVVIGPYPTPTQFAVSADNDSLTYGIAPVDFPTLTEMMDYWINQSPLYVIPRKGLVDPAHLIFEYVGDGAPAASAQAALTVNPAGDDNALTFTADGYGEAGNGISIEYVDPGVADAALAVTGDLNDDGEFAIVVLLATGSEGEIVSTAAEVKAAIENEITGWVTVEIDTSDSGEGDDGSGVVTAMAAANLEGGAGVGAGEAGKGSRYTDYTNGTLYINTGTAAQPVWNELTQAS